MKIIVTSPRNKLEDDFLTNYLIVYIEKEIAKTFLVDMIIDNYSEIKARIEEHN